MIILIPAYKPDESLVQLAQQITELDAHAEILVVDDGSGSTYVPIAPRGRYPWDAMRF